MAAVGLPVLALALGTAVLIAWLRGPSPPTKLWFHGQKVAAWPLDSSWDEHGLGEFGATITFVSNIPGETQTLPIAIYNALQLPGGELMAARLAGLSIVLALAALGFSELLARRSRARMAD